MVTRVSDLTTEELRTLIEETVARTLVGLMRDPDEGLRLRAELQQELAEAANTAADAPASSASDVAARLGLRW
ncbi:MAG: hypothetical protein RLZZ440_1164 [Planctomycetota bacterium]|jgi:hypothetical protein